MHLSVSGDSTAKVAKGVKDETKGHANFHPTNGLVRNELKTNSPWRLFALCGEISKEQELNLATLQHWVDRIRAGDVRALARAISTIEDNRPESRELLKALFNFTRTRPRHRTYRCTRGRQEHAGRSACPRISQAGKTVGILAVDPTSPYTGGAILGDRIRMQSHHADPGIYIRSMATRGLLGGLARATADVATVLDAARQRYCPH